MPFLPKLFSKNNIRNNTLSIQPFGFMQRWDQPILFGSLFFNGLRKTKQPTQTTFYSNNVKIKKIILKCLYKTPSGSFNFILQKNGIDLTDTLCLVKTNSNEMITKTFDEKFNKTDLINFKISTVEFLSGYGTSIYGYISYENS